MADETATKGNLNPYPPNPQPQPQPCAEFTPPDPKGDDGPPQDEVA